MISDPDRLLLISLIDENIAIGGNRETACRILGINQSTYFRWKQHLKTDGKTRDLRPQTAHPPPANKLSDEEKSRILDILHSPEFVDSMPNQVVAQLADQGIYSKGKKYLEKNILTISNISIIINTINTI